MKALKRMRLWQRLKIKTVKRKIRKIEYGN
jgi:hypothetical protein